jgi:uncharacterized protein (TIGR02588 family)
MSDDERQDDDRTSLPERVTFAVALAVLLAIVALIVSQIPGSKEPASPQVEVGEVAERDGHFEVPVSVGNVGEETAENVQINATLTIGDTEHTSDQSVDFLAGGETEEVVFLFSDDPSEGELEVEVGGFAVP